MAASLSDLLSAMQNGVRAINELNTSLTSFFPQATALSTTAPTGTVTFTSSRAASFLTVITSSGGEYRVALYTP